jgi:hypothetical protein
VNEKLVPLRSWSSQDIEGQALPIDCYPKRLEQQKLGGKFKLPGGTMKGKDRRQMTSANIASNVSLPVLI